MNFMENIKSKEQLISYLKDSDLENRVMYDLIKKHPLLLQKIETLINDQWNGEIVVKEC